MSGFHRLNINPETGETEVTNDPFAGATLEQGPSGKIDPERALKSLNDHPLPEGDSDNGTLRIQFHADGTVADFSRVDIDQNLSKPNPFQAEIDGMAREVERLESEASSLLDDDGNVIPGQERHFENLKAQATMLTGQLHYQMARGNAAVDQEKMAREAVVRELEREMEAQREAMREAERERQKRRHRR